MQMHTLHLANNASRLPRVRRKQHVSTHVIYHRRKRVKKIFVIYYLFVVRCTAIMFIDIQSCSAVKPVTAVQRGAFEFFFF